MRVRHLQTYLTDQRLLRQGPLSVLQGLRVGIDAAYYMRTLTGLKDPLADAIGGSPPAVYGVLDEQLRFFEKYKITPVFVFQGVVPGSHQLFSNQLHQQMDRAWECLAAGDRTEAQMKFAQATSRINSDFIQNVFHYLKARNCEVFQAPYFASSQLACFASEQRLEAVLGHPALLLSGVPRVVVGIDFQQESFEWVELKYILRIWNITKEQFVNACLLAGTEYCLTFPYLNLIQFHAGRQRFTFGTAIDFIKQADIGAYMEHFPNEEMRTEHLHGYCICKALILHPLVMLADGTVGTLTSAIIQQNSQQCDGVVALSSSSSEDEEDPSKSFRSSQCVELMSSEIGGDSERLECDFHQIVGSRLPNAVYALMAEGVISRKLPSVLAIGEWQDYSHPTVDSVEYRELLNEVRTYRCRALGLIAQNLHPEFRSREITFSRYRCNAPRGLAAMPPPVTVRCHPICDAGMPWKFTTSEVCEEMKRQGTTKVDLLFCINWHAHMDASGKGSLVDFSGGRVNVTLDDPRTLFALVHFMLLENIDYFTESGGGTVFGAAVAATSPEFQENGLFVLELMKFGILSGDKFEAPADRPYSSEISLFRHAHPPPVERSILLLSRVMSLVPMELTALDLWESEVDFDLAAFHSIVKTLKRSLRHLTEASLTTILLQDLKRVKLIGPTLFSPLDSKLPCFGLPRNCLGVVAKFFLEFDKTTDVSCPDIPEKLKGMEDDVGHLLEVELNHRFPSCTHPLQDLHRGIRFWQEVLRIVRKLTESIEDVPFLPHLEEADEFLKRRMVECGIVLSPTISSTNFSPVYSVVHHTHTTSTPMKERESIHTIDLASPPQEENNGQQQMGMHSAPPSNGATGVMPASGGGVGTSSFLAVVKGQTSSPVS